LLKNESDKIRVFRLSERVVGAIKKRLGNFGSQNREFFKRVEQIRRKKGGKQTGKAITWLEVGGLKRRVSGGWNRVSVLFLTRNNMSHISKEQNQTLPIAMRRERRLLGTSRVKIAAPTPTKVEDHNVEEEIVELSGIKPPRLELDCERRIANDKFIFYQPMYLGDFLICCWAKCMMPNSGDKIPEVAFDGKQGRIYGVAIYEDGMIVDPTSDARFIRHGRRWHSIGASWADSRFTRMEIAELVEHIKHIAEEKQNKTGRFK
jgi:hypothetical protein